MTFQDFYVWHERYGGMTSAQQALQQLKEKQSVPIFRLRQGKALGMYYIGEQQYLNDPQVGVIHPGAHDSVFEITCASSSRTDIMHLFRYKHAIQNETTRLCRKLSDAAVEQVASQANQAISQLMSRVGNRLKVVHPASQSPFNEQVVERIRNVHPNATITSLQKHTLADITPNDLFAARGIGASGQRDFISTMYARVRAANPTETFSRERVARSISQATRDLLDHEQIQYNPVTGAITIAGVTAGVIDKHAPSKFKDLMTNIFYRASDQIEQTQTRVFQPNQQLQPNDVVVFFDDNMSQGFTSSQVKRSIESQGARVARTLFGITITTQ